jgi:hypothetical protein
MPIVTMADPAVTAFLIIPIGLVLALLLGTLTASRRLCEDPSTRRRAIAATAGGSIAWMSATWIAASSGLLREWDITPPPFAFLVAGVVGISVGFAWSGFGQRLARGLPLGVLVAVQGFRVPLELAMHEMYTRGVMPVQMSYSGRNFDILTGVAALVLGPLLLAGRGSRALVLLWNIAGLALVVNVATIGILSTPRFRYFGDGQLNVWITYPPFVWLPAVMVLTAIAGHLIVFRAISAQADSTRTI